MGNSQSDDGHHGGDDDDDHEKHHKDDDDDHEKHHKHHKDDNDSNNHKHHKGDDDDHEKHHHKHHSGGSKKRKSTKASSLVNKIKGKKFAKGMPSLTRKNRKDFITHMGDKYYNRKNKREKKNVKGTKKKPYSKKSK